MDKSKSKDKQASTGEERRRHRLPCRPPARNPHHSSSTPPPADAAKTKSKHKASSSSSNSNSNKKEPKPTSPTPQPATPVPTSSASKVRLNTGDVSTWSPEMHRQYRLIQTPMVLLEKMYERPILPTGFHSPPSQDNQGTEESHPSSQRRQATSRSGCHAPASEGIGAWAADYEGMTSGDSVADSEMFNVDLDLEVYLDQVPEDQQGELLRRALARKQQRERGSGGEQTRGESSKSNKTSKSRSDKRRC